MNFMKLDKKILNLWMICSSILFILILAICILITFLLDFIYPIIIVNSLILVILFFFCYPFQVMIYNRYTFAFDEKRIIIKRGVIFKYKIIIPVCQIQDLHLSQGPLMQIAKLESIEISTAGSNYTINGINSKDAQEIVSFLENKLNERIEEIKNEKIYEEINIQ